MRFLDIVVSKGANQINGLSFDVTDKTAAMNDARLKAVADAKAKADLLAGAAGVTVGRVITISEGYVSSPGPVLVRRCGPIWPRRSLLRPGRSASKPRSTSSTNSTDASTCLPAVCKRARFGSGGGRFDAVGQSEGRRQGGCDRAPEGPPLPEALKALHELLLPATYLEIGAAAGDLLKLAHCLSVAIDPTFAININVMGTKPALHMLQGGSVDIFATPQLAGLLPDGADFAFVDGLLHLVEAAYDDLVGVESGSNQRTVAIFHDVLPINAEMAERGPVERRDRGTRDWWTGDVWKLVPIIARHRPDLRIAVLDCQPTGVLVVQLGPAQRRAPPPAPRNPQRAGAMSAWRTTASTGSTKETPLVHAKDAAAVLGVVARGRF